MATKKSSSAPGKKAAPKKKSAPVKKSAVVEQQETAVVQEVASAPLEPKVETPVVAEEKGGNGIYLFLVIAGLVALVYLVVVNQKKNAESKENSVKTEAPASEKIEAPAEEAKTEAVTEAPAETKPVAKETEVATDSPFLVAKSDIGTGKTFAEAEKFCAEKSAKLPTKTELAGFDKTGQAPEHVKKSKDKFWLSDVQKKGKTHFGFSFKDDSSKATSVDQKLSVICKK